MPSFSAEVPHSLGQQGAIDRLTSFVQQVRDKYEDQVSDLNGDWAGNQLNYSFTAFGFNIKGTVTVHEQTARVEGHLPFALIAFRGTVEQQLKSELEKALA